MGWGVFHIQYIRYITHVARSISKRTQNPHEKGTRSCMKNHMTAKTSEQQIGLPFFQRVFGKEPGEIRNASMKDCVSDPSRNFGTQHISQTRENQVILQPSPTLFKGSTHDHSTPRLLLPSLEFSSCTPCNAPFLRYEELDQATVDLCVDISAR